jgi:predicted nucleotidyltransferase
MRFGLKAEELDAVRGVLERYPLICRAEIFGSRARGDFSHRSDIDVAVYHDGMSSEEMNHLRMDLDDLPIIYRIDVVDPSRTSRPELAASIARDGVVVYERPSRRV